MDHVIFVKVWSQVYI